MLRIDDIDPLRERPGASDAIARALERYGFAWDGAIRRQSTRLERYRAALEELASRDLLYRCGCTRRQLRGRARYPGTCRPGAADTSRPSPETAGGHGASPGEPSPTMLAARPLEPPGAALRVRLAGPVRVDDAVQGLVEGELEDITGDIVLRRRDGLVAYPLACAVDDADVERVVRGADLLDASVAQHALLERLGLHAPARAHVPLAVDGEGHKLGKSTGAAPIDALAPLPTLLGVWRFLGQPPLPADTLEGFWREAPRHWSLAAVPRLSVARAPRPAP